MLGQFHARFVLEGFVFGVVGIYLIFEWAVRLGDDRAVARDADGHFHGVAAADEDGFDAGFKVHPFAVHFVLVGVVGIDLFDEQILHVGAEVGEGPGDVIVVSSHHARHAREREAGHFERTGLGDGLAMQGILVPDGRHLNAEVHVVGEQGHARGRPRASHHPAVRADARSDAPEDGFHPFQVFGEGFKFHG
jgi:hypothetical protein